MSKDATKLLFFISLLSIVISSVSIVINYNNDKKITEYEKQLQIYSDQLDASLQDTVSGQNKVVNYDPNYVYNLSPEFTIPISDGDTLRLFDHAQILFSDREISEISFSGECGMYANAWSFDKTTSKPNLGAIRLTVSEDPKYDKLNCYTNVQVKFRNKKLKPFTIVTTQRYSKPENSYYRAL